MSKTSEIFQGQTLKYLNNLMKTAERPGLWANIRAKRARGEKPAKPGDEDFPDKKQWQKLTSKKATQDMEWSRAVGGIPEMAGVFDTLKTQLPKMQNAAYNFGGKAYDFLKNLNKNKTEVSQIKPLVAGGQIR